MFDFYKAELKLPIVAALVASILIVFSSQAAFAAGPYISVDVNTGRVVKHKDAFQRWYPASLTKLMTAYLVFRAIDKGQLNRNSLVTMSEHAASKPASKMYFSIGTQFPIDSALKYLLVKSANDVAVAIGETISGSEAKFVALMNSEAKRLGMTDTRFANPNGLPGGTQYTTARDMAVLAVALRKEYPRYRSYFSYEGVDTGKKTYPNYNLLLGRFNGADGMKTGYICASGFNLVSSATRGRKTVVAVVLGATSQQERAELSADLLQRGFRNAGFGSPLKTMRPYGQNRNQLISIRNQICTKEARAQRRALLDENGHLVLKSPLLKTLTRNPRLVNAPFQKRAANSKFAKLKNIPIPAPTPVR